MGAVRVLIVDDEDDMRALLRNLIEIANDGLSVAGEAADGHQAIHRWREAQPDVVVLDQRMPGVTGLETAFSILYTDLVRPGTIELGLIVEKLAAGADAFDLERPSLAPGSEANVALCDLEAEWTVGEDGYESRSSNACWDGQRLHGRVLMTLAGGQIAYRLRSFSLGVAA